MKTIHKYNIDNIRPEFVLLEKNAKVISVREQGDENLMVWIFHDTDAPKDTEFRFHIYGTGWDMPEDISISNFIDTVIMSDGFVWHVFCETREA